MSQIQVKQIINSFCKILESFNFNKITPEDLRLAKFNKPNSAKKMWRLLFELITYLNNINKTKLERQLITDQFDELPQDKMVRFIKEQLLRFGYCCQDFYNLKPKFDEECNTSREVLITIGWLISTYEIVNRFIENLNCMLDEEYFKENALKSMKINELKKEVDSLKTQINKSKTNDLFVQINNIKLMDGIFKNKLNSLYSCLSEKAKLTHQVHSQTLGNFSCLELYLLKNTDKIEKYEKILEKKIELQNNILNWIKYEEIFWTWMESVIDEKISDKNQNYDEEHNEEFDKLLIPVMKDNLQKTYESNCLFNTKIKQLEKYENEIKSSLSTEGVDGLDKQKLASLKLFENEMIEKFQNILYNEILTTESSKNGVDYLKFDSFEPKLQFVGKKSKQPLEDSLSIKKNNEKFVHENKLLENIFTNFKNEAKDKCDSISSNLNDCYVVYNK